MCTKLKARATSFKERDTNPDANPAMPSDKPSNRQSVNTGLKCNHTTPALTLVGSLKLLMITNGNPAVSSDASLPDELNAFNARFEASNTEEITRAPAVLDDCVISLSAADVKSNQMLFVKCAEYNRCRSYSEMLTYKPCHIQRVSELV